MRVLVTGGAGFIGANLVHHLVDAGGHAVTVLDNLSAGQGAAALPPQADFVMGDFTDRATLSECLDGVDAVVHLAALSGVIDSIENPRGSFEVNVAGTFQLLELARHRGVRQVVNASTGGALLGEATPPISESMAPAPLSPYGASKLAAEGYCAAYAGAYGLSCVSLRFSNIYGPRSAHKKSVVAAFIKNAIRSRPLVVYGDGLQQRDYLFVGDLVKGIAGALGRDLVGTYQLGSGKPTSVAELIAALEAAAGKRLALRHEPARRGEVRATWCDISKATRELGFLAPTALAAGLETTWAWFLKNRDAWPREALLSSSE